MKHNQIIANIHCRKDWQRQVKTNFDQPAQKQQRRNARVAKLQKVAPRPIGLLRPVIRCPTNKYNTKTRLGRGFTFAELRAAAIDPKQARQIGIAFDVRRKNRSEEDFAVNVQRLKTYKSKLVIFPKKGGVVRAGDTPAEKRTGIVQVTKKGVFGVPRVVAQEVGQVLTKTDLASNAWATHRQALDTLHTWGMRYKKAVEKAEKAKA